MIGGGRYDGLIETMGGPHTPAVGWAGGIERLMMLCGAPVALPIEIAIIPLTSADEALSIELAALLRAAGIRAELGYSGSEKKRFEKAKKAGTWRVLNVSNTATGMPELRLRNLVANEDAEPVRKRIWDAISQRFMPASDPETRAIKIIGTV